MGGHFRRQPGGGKVLRSDAHRLKEGDLVTGRQRLNQIAGAGHRTFQVVGGRAPEGAAAETGGNLFGFVEVAPPHQHLAQRQDHRAGSALPLQGGPPA